MFTPDGGFLSSGRAAIGAPALEAGGETTFAVTVPRAADVGRYRVSFRVDDRIVPHVDKRHESHVLAAVAALAVVSLHAQQPAPQPPQRPSGDSSAFRFKSGVELINVTATVSDASGRFVPGPADRTTSSSTKTTSRRRSRTSAPSACRSASASRSTRAAAWPATRSTRRETALDRFLYDLLDRQRRDLPLPLQRPPGAAAGLDDRPPAAVARARTHHAERRHRDVRRGRRGRAAGRARAEPEEGAADHLRRQRHVEPRRRPRGASSRFARAKCWSTRSASTASARHRSPAAAATAAAPVPCRSRFPSRGGGRGRRAGSRRSFRAGRRRRSRGVGGDDRVNVAALRDMTDDSGGRTEIVRDRARSGSGDGEHRRRIEQAVLPRLSVRLERKTAAGTRSGSRCNATRAYRVRARGYDAS